MPRDKTLTHAKIIQCMREEFLKYGYERASLNRISARVGITTAGLYKHFRNKEDMFFFLVEDTLAAFKNFAENSTCQMETTIEYSPFDSDWAEFWAGFIFRHYEGVKLLICCSEGSPYECFEDDLIDLETDANKRYAEILQNNGHLIREVSDMQWHILATSYVHLIFETVRHDMTYDEADAHLRFVGDLLYPGWKRIYGLGN